MLPEAFLDRMKELLQEEYPEYLKELENGRYYALRINGLKAEKEQVEKELPYLKISVPWEKNGRYYEAAENPGKHPLHEAGAYYIQEPSAMAPAGYLQAKPGERILDLCAAPGGKSTQIAAAMMGEGIFVSNEIHPQRAKVLSENVERMGVRNCLVMNETPEHLAEVFPEFFDGIMVDAPCSGEGMFRKNEEALENWSEENVLLCAKRQRDILESADRMLKPGGRMVYSTCTFAKEENEENIEWFLKEHPEYTLAAVPLYERMSPGFDKEQKTVRLFPHRLHGEGHFLAVLQKGTKPVLDGYNIDNRHKELKSLTEKEIADYRSFEKNVLDTELSGTFLRFGDELYLAPEGSPSLKGLKVLRPGLHLGTLKKSRFEPAHALSHALFPKEMKKQCVIELRVSDERVLKYLHGETFSFSQEGMKEGFVLVQAGDFALGWGKLTKGVVKNHYPKGLRSRY